MSFITNLYEKRVKYYIKKQEIIIFSVIISFGKSIFLCFFILIFIFFSEN